jgi:hypothetical protein
VTAHDRVTNALHNLGCHGRGTSFQCPAHDDGSPSLSVTRGAKGVVLNCHAGCATEDVVTALKLTMGDLFDEPMEKRERPQIVAQYPYVDERGELLLTVRRMEPGYDGERKTFRQYKPDGTAGVRGIRRVLYRLPEVLAEAAAAGTILVVEGEKDVDSLAKIGAVATCNIGGAGKWSDAYTPALRGASDVVVIADRDEPGRKHAATVADSVRRAGIPVRVVEPARGKDVSDHLAAGLGYDDLVPLDVDQAPEAPPEDDEPQREPDLVFRVLADIAADVDSRPPRPWLFKPVIVSGDYGVMSAQDKAGKTWGILDASVSCAGGLDWLGIFPAGDPGPVLVFLGEGSDSKMLRRIRAVARAKGLTKDQADALPIIACFRAPQLGDAQHRHYVRRAVEHYRPKLVIIDPLYLAAGGANGADLYAMGVLLGSIQHIVQSVGASLLISHHWNKTGEGNGHSRSSGVGPGAWGRFLISVAVLNSRTDKETQETTVRLKWMFKGDEIPETETTIVRRVRAEDPEDLNSPMHYSVEQVDGDVTEDDQTPPELVGLRPAAVRVLDVLGAASHPISVKGIGDRLAESKDGKGPLKARTIQDALRQLAERKLADDTTLPGTGALWLALAPREATNAA